MKVDADTRLPHVSSPIDDLTIRGAMWSDNEALLALEAITPIKAGQHKILFDRSPNYFTQMALWDNAVILVAEKGNSIVGSHAMTCYPTIINGHQMMIAKGHALRVSPEVQGLGLGTELSRACERETKVLGAQIVWAVLDPGNFPMAKTNDRVAPWQHQNFSYDDSLDQQASKVPTVSLLVLDLRDFRFVSNGDNKVIRASLEYAEAIIEILNDTHKGKDLFMPYSLDSFMGRLTRGKTYSLRDFYVYVGQDGQATAVAGLWRQCEVIREIRINEISNEHCQITRAAVADWGFKPGHEKDFVKLLQCICDEVKTEGISELFLSTCDHRLDNFIQDYISAYTESLWLYSRNMLGETLLPQPPYYFDPLLL